MPRKKTRKARYEVRKSEGLPHGDLYELEQSFYFDVVEIATGKRVMRFEGEVSCSLGKGTWDLEGYSGVERVELAPDGEHVDVWEAGAEGPRRVRIDAGELGE